MVRPYRGWPPGGARGPPRTPVGLHYAWGGPGFTAPGRALQWWLQRLQKPHHAQGPAGKPPPFLSPTDRRACRVGTVKYSTSNVTSAVSESPERQTMSKLFPPPRPRRNDNPPGARAPLRHHRRRHGIACARTPGAGEATASRCSSRLMRRGAATTVNTVLALFDIGAQYFTVRDPRFARHRHRARLCKPWSANNVRVLDATGRVTSQGLLSRGALGAQPRHAIAGGCLGAATATGRVGHSSNTSAARGARQPEPTGWQLRTQGADGSPACVCGI